MNKRLIRRLAIASASLLLVAISAGSQLGATAADVPNASDATATDAHPVLPVNDHWAYLLLLIIFLALFIPAMIVGPLSRYLAAEELPELHTAEEREAHLATQHEPGHSERT